MQLARRLVLTLAVQALQLMCKPYGNDVAGGQGTRVARVRALHW